MAHVLTINDQYTSYWAVTVNDNNATSPYTLQNGDIIKVPTLTQGITINGTSYSTRSENVLNISNEDITVVRTGAEKTIDPVPYITINYTESGGGHDMSETWVLNASENTTKLTNTNVNFTSNNQSFKGIGAAYAPSYGPFEIRYYQTTSFQSGTQVKTEDGTWVDDAWRTIVFDEPVTDTTLLTWLQANGTKQTATVNYTISETELTTIADSIRTKTSSSDKLTPSAMAEKIKTIPIITDISDAATLTAKLTEGNIGNFYRYTGTATSDYAAGAIYQVTQV